MQVCKWNNVLVVMLIARIADATAPFGCVESVVEILGKRGWDHFECETLQYCQGYSIRKSHMQRRDDNKNKAADEKGPRG